MISPQGEHIRNELKNVIGPMLKATLNAPLETRRAQFEAMMSQIELPPDVEIEEIETGGVPCEWVRISAGAVWITEIMMMVIHTQTFACSTAHNSFLHPVVSSVSRM